MLQSTEQKDRTSGQFWARIQLEFNSDISSFICFQDFIQMLLLSGRNMLSFRNTSLYKRHGNTQVKCRSHFHFPFISGGKRQGTHEERHSSIFLLIPQAVPTQGSSTDRTELQSPSLLWASHVLTEPHAGSQLPHTDPQPGRVPANTSPEVTLGHCQQAGHVWDTPAAALRLNPAGITISGQRQEKLKPLQKAGKPQICMEDTTALGDSTAAGKRVTLTMKPACSHI